MQIKQSGGKVFGAVLTAKERKAMEIEINRQILEADRQYQDDIDAAVIEEITGSKIDANQLIKKMEEADL